MRKLAVLVAAVMMMVFGSVVVAHAVTADEAKAMTEKAVAFWKANGKEKAIAEFNNQKGQFVKGDLYVFVNEFGGAIVANGGNPKLVGQNHLELKDPSGKLFNKEMVEVAKTKGSGWIDYVWTNPISKKVQPKSAWIQRIEGTDSYLGCGYWK
jgi:cytochrome c